MDGTEVKRTKARVLATQSGQKQFRDKAVELFEDLKRPALTPDDRYVLALLYESQGGDAGPQYAKSCRA